jgi:hypothetical protein
MRSACTWRGIVQAAQRESESLKLKPESKLLHGLTPGDGQNGQRPGDRKIAIALPLRRNKALTENKNTGIHQAKDTK